MQVPAYHRREVWKRCLAPDQQTNTAQAGVQRWTVRKLRPPAFSLQASEALEDRRKNTTVKWHHPEHSGRLSALAHHARDYRLLHIGALRLLDYYTMRAHTYPESPTPHYGARSFPRP